MVIIETKSVREKINKVRKLILSAGNQIASVHFRKREDGSRRRMCFRLHVQKPFYAKSPIGKGKKHKQIDRNNKQLTVFDVNKILYRNNKMNGRGAWRTIPMENVERMKVLGTIYKFI